jgi:hypothetical protein
MLGVTSPPGLAGWRCWGSGARGCRKYCSVLQSRVERECAAVESRRQGGVAVSEGPSQFWFFEGQRFAWRDPLYTRGGQRQRAER